MKHIKLFEGTWKEMQDKKFARRDLADHIEDNLIDNLIDCLFEIFDKYHILEGKKTDGNGRPNIYWEIHNGGVYIDRIDRELAVKIYKDILKIRNKIEKRLFRRIKINQYASPVADNTGYNLCLIKISIGKDRVYEEFNLYNKDTMSKLESLSEYLQDIFSKYAIKPNGPKGPYWTIVAPKYDGVKSYGSICINLSSSPYLLKLVTKDLEDIKPNIEEKLGFPIEVKNYGGESYSVFVKIENDYKKWIKTL